MDTLKKVEVVERFHAGQQDKNGYDYYAAHLVPVALSVPKHLTYVALAHDILEDTDATPDDLREAGFAEWEIRTIEALTKKKGEPLDRYILRVRSNINAQIVKTADVMNNVERLHKIRDATTYGRLYDKYQRTLLLLQGIF